MTDIINTIRAFADKLRDDGEGETRIVGTTGAHVALTRAEVAKDLLALLDGLPSPTSPDRIPPRLRESLDRYASSGIRTGGCLHAILSNDLVMAFASADPETAAAMPAIVAYIASRLPAACWGSHEIVEQWMARARS